MRALRARSSAQLVAYLCTAQFACKTKVLAADGNIYIFRKALYNVPRLAKRRAALKRIRTPFQRGLGGVNTTKASESEAFVVSLWQALAPATDDRIVY